jgi:hypothetical protein
MQLMCRTLFDITTPAALVRTKFPLPKKIELYAYVAYVATLPQKYT